MAAASVRIPGTPDIVAIKKARIDAAVPMHWNAATAPPEKKIRWPGAGDLGRRLQTARLP